MQWLTIVFLGIAANLDNLGVGLAFGIRKTAIPFRSNCAIAVVSMVMALVAMLAAEYVTQFMPETLANRLGGGMLCVIGAWMLFHPQSPRPKFMEDPAASDLDGDRVLSVREALPLGFLLAANSLAGGFGMGVSGGPMAATVLSIGLFSLLTIGGGHRFGGLLTRTWIGRYPSEIAGGLLVLIGIAEMII
ncbi:manganese efflux pump [Bhargavaea ullalensis]|uniref:Mn2+ efflux pump MntP n=1 Tax=Bhargavaea ullalensis TaxID=1265685 RepID=A0ABV2GBE9_9BACL